METLNSCYIDFESALGTAFDSGFILGFISFGVGFILPYLLNQFGAK